MPRFYIICLAVFLFNAHPTLCKSSSRQVIILNHIYCKPKYTCIMCIYVLQMTVMIEPGDDFCFHVPNITEGQTFEFDYQVTESTGAEGINDITVRVTSPKPE